MAIRHTRYTSTNQDQELTELVAPKVLNEVHDLIDSMFELFAEAYKLELRDEGWTPPA